MLKIIQEEESEGLLLVLLSGGSSSGTAMGMRISLGSWRLLGILLMSASSEDPSKGERV